ncbi:hypothetical protein D3C75_780560 [compost metagenome]
MVLDIVHSKGCDEVGVLGLSHIPASGKQQRSRQKHCYFDPLHGVFRSFPEVLSTGSRTSGLWTLFMLGLISTPATKSRQLKGETGDKYGTP